MDVKLSDTSAVKISDNTFSDIKISDVNWANFPKFIMKLAKCPKTHEIQDN